MKLRVKQSKFGKTYASCGRVDCPISEACGRIECPISELTHAVPARNLQEVQIQKEYRDIVRILLTAARRGCCLVGSLALQHRLLKQGIQTELRIGYKLCYYHIHGDNRERGGIDYKRTYASYHGGGIGVFAIRHVWVEACGRVWDVGNAVNMVLYPHLRKFPYRITYILPPDVMMSYVRREEDQGTQQLTLLEYLYLKLTRTEGYTEQYKKDMIKHGWPRFLVNKLFCTLCET